MDYYTKFELDFERKDRMEMSEAEVAAAVKEIEKTLADINPNYFKDIEYTHFFEEELKWYDYRSDMIALSEHMPEYVFILSGEGEDREDTWIKYYWNGASEECYATVTIPGPKVIYNL